MATVGGASAALGAGTVAYFSDSVDSEDNTIEAGDIDLRTNGDNTATTTFSVSDVAPGQSGSSFLPTSNVGSIDGYVSLEFDTPDSRNDLTEVLEITVKYAGNVIRRGTFDTVFDGEGEWSNADIPLPAGANRNLEVQWSVPGGAGNDIQNEEAVGDLTIRLNQQQAAFADVVVNNDGSANATTIQEAVDAVPSGGVVLVEAGTYNEAVDIDTDDLTLAAKGGPNSSGAVRVETSAQSHDNRAVEINAADGVTVDGFDEITFNSDPSSNSEKYAVRARSASNGLTVRNCTIGNFSTQDRPSNGGAVRTTGIVVDAVQGPDGEATVTDPIIENNVLDSIENTGGLDQNDSKAKGIAINGNVQNAAVNNNDITNIGRAGGGDETDEFAERVTESNVGGTEKPRGISLIEDSNGDGPTNFTVLDNLFQGIVGTFGQPAIFIGGSNGLGGDHEVYNNQFEHPVDNLSAGVLKLRDNTWVNDNAGLPQLKAPPGGSGDPEVDGGNLIDRDGGSEYDTTFTL